jgi:dTDP-4-amino-4,6-dideoxygalactose transaminase
MLSMKFSFCDLNAQYQVLKKEIDSSIQKVLDDGLFVNGPEVQSLEEQLSLYTGAKFTVTCGSGTDALLLVLIAKGIKPGDAVIVPTFSFVATAEAVVLAGGVPIFVDVLPHNFTLDPKEIEKGIHVAKKKGLKPRAIIPVDLFGHPAQHQEIQEIAEEYGLWVLDDAAQSFGAMYQGRRIGKEGLATATSFYPAKPLGCYGDGGAIFTDDETLALSLKSIRSHGYDLVDRYEHLRIGTNSRLDTIQAAILLQKLKVLDHELGRRALIALRYTDSLKDVVSTPTVSRDCRSSWAQYTILCQNEQLDRLVSIFQKQGIPFSRFYPKPIHKQAAYKNYPTGDKNLPVSEELSQTVISLPIHAYMSIESQQAVIEGVLESALYCSEKRLINREMCMLSAH